MVSERTVKWLFFAPGFVVLLFVIIVPLAFNYVLLFFKWHLTNPFQREPVFVGFDNFIYLLTENESFWRAWYRTLIFAAIVVPTEFGLGLILALALNRRLSFERTIRTLIMLPLAMAPVAVGALWRVIFSPAYGVVNYFLGFFGVPPQPWMSDTSQSLLTAAIVDIWQWTPFMSLVLLAGLTSLPREPLEAAMIDGASSSQIFRHLVLPMMKTVILVILTLRLMDAIKTYDILYTLTYGGPGTSTTLITYHISLTAFRKWRMGIAATENIVTALLISFLIVIFIKLMPKRR
jgi:multiple sugar transport system permease protein